MSNLDLFADRLIEVWATPGQAGAGVAVGDRGILTARHLIAAALNSNGEILVRIVPIGTAETIAPLWVAAAHVWDDEMWDLAVLEAVDDGWVTPNSANPAIVALGSRPEIDCHTVGFSQHDVQIDQAGELLRQTTSVVGRLLPAGQARPPVNPVRPLPPRWLPLLVDTDPAPTQADWGGMSGAGVTLSDGRLAAIVAEAGFSEANRQLLVVPLSDALLASRGFKDALSGIAGVGSIVAEARDAPRFQRHLMPQTLSGSGAPMKVGEQVDLDAFGVKPARLAGEESLYLPYITRDGDWALRDAMRSAACGPDPPRMILVVGTSASGKSRSAAEAAGAELAGRTLLRPIPGEHHIEQVAAWSKTELSEALVWLDDVERYAHPGLAATIRRVLGTGAAVVASIRTKQLEELAPTGDLLNPVGEALTDQRLVREIRLRREWSPGERNQAATVLVNEGARRAVLRGVSLGVWAVAGQELITLFNSVRNDDDHPERYALVRAVLDWYHTGHTRPAPQKVITELLTGSDNPYPPPTGPTGFSAEELEQAITVLGKPVLGSSRDGNSLILHDPSAETLSVHDYVLDQDQTSEHVAPEAIWYTAAAEALVNANEAAAVAFAAYHAREVHVAEALWSLLAEAGDPGSMYNLAVVLGKTLEAEAWCRKAADLGNSRAMNHLGFMLAERGETREAEDWWRKSAELGNNAAMNALGASLHRRGKENEAVTLWHKAADRGHAEAMYNLGVVHDLRGETILAENWWRKAADLGYSAAMHNLGVANHDRGQTVQAENWWRKAADLGDSESMYSLGMINRDRGETALAEKWWRKAADSGHIKAKHSLDILIAEHGLTQTGDASWRNDAGTTEFDDEDHSGGYQVP